MDPTSKLYEARNHSFVSELDASPGSVPPSYHESPPSYHESPAQENDAQFGRSESFISLSSRGGEAGHERLQEEARLVIGLDYGTTYTGVAYATPSGPDIHLSEIDVMVEWGGQLDEKVPYSYKNPEEIVCDYLTEVFRYFEEQVGYFGQAVREVTATDIVVTIPSEYSYKAKNATYRAWTKAGFNRSTFPMLQNLMFVTEAEAAAAYAARHFRDEDIWDRDILRKNGYFILCDAGGGTVDVVSYQVKQLHPRLELEQIGPATGRKCGSIFINIAFQKWLRKLIKDENFRKLDLNLDVDKGATQTAQTPAMRALMAQFDQRKRSFTMKTGDFKMDLPRPLENLTIRGVVDKGAITVTRNDMEEFFDVCVGEVIELIQEHIDTIRKLRQNRPKEIFLVGGFGESEYLQHMMKDTLKLEEMKMKYYRPKNSGTAVVRGATLLGIGNWNKADLVTTKSCQHSYGICLDEKYETREHAGQIPTELNGVPYILSQLHWLMNEGDLVLSGEPYVGEKEFRYVHEPSNTAKKQMLIYKSLVEEEERPSYFGNAKDDLDVVGILEIDLSRIGLPIQSRWEATLRIVLRLDPGTDSDRIEAYLYYNSEVISRCTIS